jgi:hypothetical protein
MSVLVNKKTRLICQGAVGTVASGSLRAGMADAIVPALRVLGSL